MNFFTELHRVNKKSQTAKLITISVHFHEVFVIGVALVSFEELAAYSTARGEHSQTKKMLFSNIRVTDLWSWGSRIPSFTSSRRPRLSTFTLSQIAKRINSILPMAVPWRRMREFAKTEVSRGPQRVYSMPVLCQSLNTNTQNHLRLLTFGANVAGLRSIYVTAGAFLLFLSVCFQRRLHIGQWTEWGGSPLKYAIGLPCWASLSPCSGGSTLPPGHLLFSPGFIASSSVNITVLILTDNLLLFCLSRSLSKRPIMCESKTEFL